MRIYKVLPDLSNERQMKLWHKAQKNQWSALDLNWDRPLGVRSRALRDEMGRLLTPVLMGEQSALYSVSSLIPVLGRDSEIEGQFYLTSWAMDEARHTELFARFYRRLEREPLPIRRFPSGYLFQSRIISKDVAEWLSGVLVSEVLAKLVMEEFLRLDLDPVLSEISEGILRDEARHLGFNHIYLEDRFRTRYAGRPDEAAAFAAHLRSRLAGVLEGVPPMVDVLRNELRRVGMDRDRLLHDLGIEAAERLERSIEGGFQKAGLPYEAPEPAPPRVAGA